jgi:hypothetical protein
MGTRPPCAICMGPGHGPRERLQLPHGISVWLCEQHRSPEFLRSRAGRDFVVSLSGVWNAAGCMTAARHRLLMGHQARIAPPGPAPRPGSYAWPELRQEAEARWAAGAPCRPVIDELRARHADDSAHVPSVRTMQRWFADGRWLGDGGGRPIPAGGGRPSEGPVAGTDPGPTLSVQDGTGDTRHGGPTDDAPHALHHPTTLRAGGVHLRRGAHRHRHPRAARGGHDPGVPRPAGEGAGRGRAVAAALRRERRRVGVGRPRLRRPDPDDAARRRAEHRLADRPRRDDDHQRRHRERPVRRGLHPHHHDAEGPDLHPREGRDTVPTITRTCGSGCTW